MGFEKQHARKYAAVDRLHFDTEMGTYYLLTLVVVSTLPKALNKSRKMH